MKIKAALFDLDGVVFDTEPQYTVFWGGECRRYHPEEPGLEHRIKGQTLEEIYERCFSGNLAAEQAAITRRLNDFEARYPDTDPAYEDATQLSEFASWKSSAS